MFAVCDPQSQTILTHGSTSSLSNASIIERDTFKYQNMISLNRTEKNTGPQSPSFSDLSSGMMENKNLHVNKRKRITTTQLSELERFFNTNPKPNAEKKRLLSETLGISLKSIQIWFQNKRSKVAKSLNLHNFSHEESHKTISSQASSTLKANDIILSSMSTSYERDKKINAALIGVLTFTPNGQQIYSQIGTIHKNDSYMNEGFGKKENKTKIFQYKEKNVKSALEKPQKSYHHHHHFGSIMQPKQFPGYEFVSLNEELENLCNKENEKYEKTISKPSEKLGDNGNLKTVRNSNRKELEWIMVNEENILNYDSKNKRPKSNSPNGSFASLVNENKPRSFSLPTCSLSMDGYSIMNSYSFGSNGTNSFSNDVERDNDPSLFSNVTPFLNGNNLYHSSFTTKKEGFVPSLELNMNHMDENVPGSSFYQSANSINYIGDGYVNKCNATLNNEKYPLAEDTTHFPIYVNNNAVQTEFLLAPISSCYTSNDFHETPLPEVDSNVNSLIKEYDYGYWNPSYSLEESKPISIGATVHYNGEVELALSHTRSDFSNICLPKNILNTYQGKEAFIYNSNDQEMVQDFLFRDNELDNIDFINNIFNDSIFEFTDESL